MSSCFVFLAEAFGDSGKWKTTTKLSVVHSSLLEVKRKEEQAMQRRKKIAGVIYRLQKGEKLLRKSDAGHFFSRMLGMI